MSRLGLGVSKVGLGALRLLMKTSTQCLPATDLEQPANGHTGIRLIWLKLEG